MYDFKTLTAHFKIKVYKKKNLRKSISCILNFKLVKYRSIHFNIKQNQMDYLKHKICAVLYVWMTEDNAYAGGCNILLMYNNKNGIITSKHTMTNYTAK